jgi:hypothetical protein
MTRTKLLGLAVAASLLAGYEPIAEASPIAAPPSEFISNLNGPLVQIVTRAGVAHRSARRTSRRVARRHGY